MKRIFPLCLSIIFLTTCNNNPTNPQGILGFELLDDIKGHWVGTNETAFGNFDWFAFDFRPISASHVHSIYEGATQQNIITSVFVADHEGSMQIMARNGGWLGNQYRATYYVLDRAELSSDRNYYRLVDAIGKDNRSYIEFVFENDQLRFDAYKDNSGSLDEPVHHMGFVGLNQNPSYAEHASDLFGFPQPTSEVNLNGQFEVLIDPDSALFLEEDLDPFPKADHKYISDLQVNIDRDGNANNQQLIYFLSKTPIISPTGNIDLNAINTQVIRTITIKPQENSFQNEYVHPDDYYVTIFHDVDGDFIPSAGDISTNSTKVTVGANTTADVGVILNVQL